MQHQQPFQGTVDVLVVGADLGIGGGAFRGLGIAGQGTHNGRRLAAGRRRAPPPSPAGPGAGPTRAGRAPMSK